MEKKPVTYCVVDTFTDSPFKENPTAVCLLDEEREDDEWFQTVASEFNLPMTCFLNSIADSESETHDSSHSSINPRFRLRWFNPVAQVTSPSLKVRKKYRTVCFLNDLFGC
ncbi:phenazine biosynthesis-like domain-containing protein 1 isoform X1 [Camellia sinensis]|uniref:phenazine biosynthesis-like domain-containing protein 1 isoform X1 n=1 Tax=Camellia sinensis TaxID=4442 RepID=UPI001035839B|nr:phenazine biosynthesis-like domain-containing protein 1 isoform X1 [Camellia sinensis]